MIIDPVPCRLGLPSLRYVDVGKMLQSAAGWENALVPGWSKPSDEAIDFILEQELPHVQPACLFWAAVNCARVVVRAKRDDIKKWGEDKSRMFIERMQDALRV